MRSFIQHSLDRVHADMAKANNGRFDYNYQPFSSFHVYHGHHIGRILVKLIRGQTVKLDAALAKKLLWRHQSRSATAVVPAHFSKSRNAMFFGALTDSDTPQHIDNIALAVEEHGLPQVEIELRGFDIVVRYTTGVTCSITSQKFPQNEPTRTHYQVELDGLAPIVQAIMVGDREIIVHVKSLFESGVPASGRNKVSMLAVTTLEMLIHVLLERYGNRVSYAGKCGTLALKHLIHLVLSSNEADRISVAPGAYLSTRVNVYNDCQEIICGFEVDAQGVLFREGLTVEPFRPGPLSMPSEYNWVTGCAVAAERLLFLKEGVQYQGTTIGQVDVPAPQPKHEFEYHRLLVVQTQDRLEMISADDGKVVFSAACTNTKEDDCVGSLL